ncbi:hypothetical protein JHK85_034345 [Glycine max]|nr:hypothetical protein JHK85_034345 [Glycine max]
MAAEHVLRLLDSFWFEASILSSKIPPTNPISHNHKVVEEVLPLDDAKLLLVPTPTLEVRSYSDQNLDSTTCVLCDYSPSPNSVLTPQRLRTIPSEREIREFSSGNHGKEGMSNKRKQKGFGHGRRPRQVRTSRSLSELEFKELKGFMDLGFVFSEEDKDSKLASLIPGLQRLGREDDEVQCDDQSVVSDNNKPYLSEAWDVLDQRELRNPLLNWRVPARGNEIDMKDNLRFWAHTVASISKILISSHADEDSLLAVIEVTKVANELDLVEGVHGDLHVPHQGHIMEEELQGEGVLHHATLKS